MKNIVEVVRHECKGYSKGYVFWSAPVGETVKYTKTLKELKRLLGVSYVKIVKTDKASWSEA